MQYNIPLCILSILSVPDEGYSRDASCALIYVFIKPANGIPTIKYR